MLKEAAAALAREASLALGFDYSCCHSHATTPLAAMPLRELRRNETACRRYG